MPDDDDMQMIPTEPNTQADTQMEATQPGTQPDPTPQKEPTPNEEPARRTTQDSFHSAREAASKEPTAEPMQVDFEHEHQREHGRGEMDFEYTFPPRTQEKQPEYPTLPTNERRSSKNDTMQESMLKSPEPGHQAQDELDEHLDDIGSPSDNSTPDRPLIRKSSLNFASLPAREPLNTKRSMGGARNSYIDRGFFGRQTGARLTQAVEKNDEKMDVEERPEQKSSTQLLHEKINMLGKTQAPRTTKSVSANAQSVAYPDLSASRREPSEERIKPREQTPAEALNRPSTSQQPSTARKPFESPRPQTSHAERKTPGSIADGRSPARGMFNPSRFWHGKSNSTSSMLASPPKNAEQSHIDTTTPANSPGRYEGPLSASRGRLQSIMKSAKGLFSSSAGASAAARLESQSPTANRSVRASPLQRSESRMAQQSPVKPEGRRTRSSTEREQRRKQEEARERERREQEERERREREEREERERMEREERERLERQREERARIERDREEREERERIEREEHERREKEEQRVREEEKRREAQKNAPVMQKLDRVQVPVTRMNQSSPRKQVKSSEEEHKFAIPKPKGRPVKPTRETAKPKPQPVSIRVGTHSQRMAMSQHPPESAPSTGLRSTTGNNTSSTSLHTATSSSSFKSTSSAASTKSKTTVAKKKEAEAQRRLEARREAERKKAAQEEARRLEQAEAERRERERAAQEDPKKAAQRQAIEKRRLENARKLEQQQQQRVQATPSRPRVSFVFCWVVMKLIVAGLYNAG